MIDFGFVFGVILGIEIDPKSNSKFDRFLNRFFMIFGRFGEPSWGHVGDILAKNKVALWGARVFVVAIPFSVGFGRSRDRFWSDFGPSGTDFGPIWGRCWSILGRFLAEFLIELKKLLHRLLSYPQPFTFGHRGVAL